MNTPPTSTDSNRCRSEFDRNKHEEDDRSRIFEHQLGRSLSVRGRVGRKPTPINCMISIKKKKFKIIIQSNDLILSQSYIFLKFQ